MWWCSPGRSLYASPVCQCCPQTLRRQPENKITTCRLQPKRSSCLSHSGVSSLFFSPAARGGKTCEQTLTLSLTSMWFLYNSDEGRRRGRSGWGSFPCSDEPTPSSWWSAERPISFLVTQTIGNKDVAHDAFNYGLLTDLYAISVEKWNLSHALLPPSSAAERVTAAPASAVNSLLTSIFMESAMSATCSPLISVYCGEAHRCTGTWCWSRRSHFHLLVSLEVTFEERGKFSSAVLP